MKVRVGCRIIGRGGSRAAGTCRRQWLADATLDARGRRGAGGGRRHHARERVIAYCGGGIAASALAFNLLRAGWTDIAVYDGSLDEWGRDPALPMETGPG